MTLQELYHVSDCLDYSETVHVLYNGHQFEARDDNHQERLIGIWDDMEEKVFWVRIENCLLAVGTQEQIDELKNQSKQLLDNFMAK